MSIFREGGHVSGFKNWVYDKEGEIAHVAMNRA